MEDLPGLVELLKSSGPLGATVAGIIVGLALALILVGHFKGIWDGGRSSAAALEFQNRLLTLVEKLTVSEEALRRRIDEMARDHEARQEEIEDLRVQMVLLRNQRRRLIDYLRRALPAVPKPRTRS